MSRETNEFNLWIISDHTAVGNNERCLDFARHDNLIRAQELEFKPRIKFAAVLFSTTGETRDCAAHTSHARKFLPTIRTAIDKSRRISSRRERQVMTALLVCDSQVAASLPPLGAMRRDAVPARPKLSHKMGKFMSQSAIDFGRIVKEPGIQRNELLTIVSAASRRFQACIPFDAKVLSPSDWRTGCLCYETRTRVA